MVTVIIPTYKRTDNIEKAINSVLNQTYQNFEIIVVDDNDEDTIYRKDMIEIMKKYENNEKIKYIKHMKNKNGAAARNTGIKNSNGNYITFLDDDDYFMPNRLKILVDSLENKKEYNAAYTATVLIKDGRIIGNTNARKSGKMNKELLLNEFSFGTGSNMFFRANALKDINGFDERFLRHQDIECMLRFFRTNKILGINKTLVIKGQNDRSNEPGFEQYKKIKKLYLETFKKDIMKLDSENQKKIYKLNTEALISNAIKNKKYSQIKELKVELKKYGYNYQFFNKSTLKNVINILNNYLPIKKLEEFVRTIICQKNIEDEVKEVIKEQFIVK